MNSRVAAAARWTAVALVVTYVGFLLCVLSWGMWRETTHRNRKPLPIILVTTPPREQVSPAIVIPLVKNRPWQTARVQIGDAIHEWILDTGAGSTLLFRERTPYSVYVRVGETGKVKFPFLGAQAESERVHFQMIAGTKRFHFARAHLISLKNLPKDFQKLTRGATIGILGVDFLKPFRFKLRRDALILLPSGSETPDHALPFEWNHAGHIQFRGTLYAQQAELPVQVVLDTGLGKNLPPLVLHPRVQNALSGAEREKHDRRLCLQLGNQTLHSLHYGVQERAIYEADVLLGAGALEHCTIVVDAPQRRIWFEPAEPDLPSR